MKNKNIIIILLLLVTQLSLFAQNYSIKLVFNPGFSNSFQSGKPWVNLDPQIIKDTIVAMVTIAYSSYNYSVSVMPYPYNGVAGDVIAHIGVINPGNDFGNATSGVGSYCSNNSAAYCDIYSNNFANFTEFQGVNATNKRIGRAIGRTVVHEIGHLFNLYHAYMFDYYDPTRSEAAASGNLYPEDPTTKGSPNVWDGFALSSSPVNEHFMATVTKYVTYEGMATIDNVHFSDYSKEILNFVKNAGGAVNQNMIWGVPGGHFYLNSNVIVDGVRTFYAAAGYGDALNYSNVLYLNGHKIRVNVPGEGGKIVVVGTVSPNSISLRYSRNNLTRLTGIYPNLIDAINDAETNETIVVSSGTHNINQNVIIPAGVTLELQSGVTVNFNGNLTVNGTLKTNGATLKFGSRVIIINGRANCESTTFQTSSNGFWGGIMVNNTGIIDTVAVTFTLSNCSLLNSNSIVINGRKIKINGTKIVLTMVGLDFMNYSLGDIQPNNVFESIDFCIYGDESSYIFAGDNSKPGSNSFRGVGGYLFSYYKGSIYAQHNYWARGYPGGTQNIVYAPILPTDPNPKLSRSPEDDYKAEVELELFLKKTAVKNDEPIKEKVPGIEELDEAIKLLYAEKYDEALLEMYKLVDNYQDGFVGKRALVFIENILAETGRSKEILAMLNGYSVGKSKVAQFANYRKGYQYLHLGEYDKAIAIMKATEFVEEDAGLRQERLSNLGIIYHDYLDKKAEAYGYFNELAKNYPESRLTKAIQRFYNIKSDGYDKSSTTEETVITETKLFANYPNPFNPSTVIKYQLSEASQVNLKVYDVMGREVTTLVNSFQNKGSYDVTFNANGFSSGIYFYKLDVNGKQHMNKMLLMK